MDDTLNEPRDPRPPSPQVAAGGSSPAPSIEDLMVQHGAMVGVIPPLYLGRFLYGKPHMADWKRYLKKHQAETIILNLRGGPFQGLHLQVGWRHDLTCGPEVKHPDEGKRAWAVQSSVIPFALVYGQSEPSLFSDVTVIDDKMNATQFASVIKAMDLSDPVTAYTSIAQWLRRRIDKKIEGLRAARAALGLGDGA